MKKLLSTVCALCMAASAAVFPVRAEDNGIYEDAGGNIYKYHTNSLGASIDKIKIAGDDAELIIPAEIEDTTVYMISDYAFDKADRNKVKKVKLESDISSFRFEVMENLTEVSLPDSLKKIPELAFLGCISLKSITIPNGVTEIGSQAFEGCTSLTSIVIPDSVKRVGDMAFVDCSSLADIKWNDNIDLGLSVFNGTKYLADYDEDFILINNGKTLYAVTGKSNMVEIPETVTNITQFAFDGSQVRKVICPASMTTIPQNAFCGASKLEEVEFKGNVTEMEMSAFQNCISLKEAVIPKGVTKIPFACFAGCKAIENIVIPDTVTSIEDEAFENCKGAKTVSFSNNCSVIPEMCFAYCESLTSITIPDSIKRIESGAFISCSALSDVTMSPSTVIESDAFKNTLYGKTMSLPQSTDKPSRKTWEDENDAPARTAKPRVAPSDALSEVPTSTPQPDGTDEPEQRGKIDVISGDKLIVEVNEKAVAFPDAEPYIDENSRTQIPIRAVAEALGAKVDWDSTEHMVTITKNNKVITIAIGDNTMQVGNETIVMDTAAEIIDGRTYIPLRFVGEALGMTVNWVNQ